MELARGAAVAARLPAAEAWALHQLGTRALLEGQTDAARTALERALVMRRALGDRIGAELTRYHLALLLPPSPLPRASNVSSGLAVGLVAGAGLSSGVKGTLALLGLLLLLGAGLLGRWQLGGAGEPLPAFLPGATSMAVAVVETATTTATPTLLPTATVTPLPTATPTTLPSATPTPLPTATLWPTQPPSTPLPTVSINDAPLVHIFSPVANQHFRADELIRFGAVAVDSEDEQMDGPIAWFSSLDGPLSTAAAFTHALSPGQHRITARAVDRLGQPGEATLIIFVDLLPDSAPTLAIETPSPGETLVAGEVVVLRAEANDQPDGDISERVIWRSEREGVLGQGPELRRVFPAGDHVIVAAVTDAGGQMTEQWVTLVVTPPDLPPEIVLVLPRPGVPLEAGVPVAVAGVATDPEDGNLSQQLQWRLNEDRWVGQGEAFELPLLPGSYRLTATVTDSGGNEGQATVDFVVPNGPDLVITVQQVDVVQSRVGQFSIPILLVVTNRGDTAANPFEIAAEYTLNGFTSSVQLGDESYDVFTSDPLAPGESFRYAGEVLVFTRSELYGRTVSLSVVADSCSGTEKFAATCRVAESDEANNRSPIIDVILPAGLN